MTTHGRAFDVLRIWVTYYGKVRDVASVIPYNRRYSGFVGVDIYDDPR